MDAKVVEAPALRQRFSFERMTDEAGDLLLVETWVDPGGGVTPHLHPVMEERFEILEGRPSFLAGRKWDDFGPGETVVVPPGTRHAYKNKTGEVVHFVARVRPPSTLQEFLEDTAGLARAGKITRQGIPKGLSGLLAGVVLAHHYREMAVLLFPPLPPPAIQRLILPPLARLAERRGYRAGELAKLA